MPIKCSNCSKEYPDQAIFCGTCGIKLNKSLRFSETNQQDKASPNTKPDVKKQSDNKKFTKFTTLAVITGLTTLLSIILASTLPFKVGTTGPNTDNIHIPHLASIITWITGFCFLIALATIRIKENQKMLSILTLLTFFVLGSCFGNCVIVMQKDGPLKHQPIETANQQTTEEKAKTDADSAKAKADADSAKAKADADSAKAKADAAQEKTKNFQIGMDFLINQNYDKAIASFKKHIELNPDDINGYIKIAEAYYESNQQNEAFKYINKALEINPSNQNAIALKNNIQVKRLEIQINEDYKKIEYLAIGTQYFRERNFQKAIENIEKHIKLNPDDIHGYMTIAVSFQELKNFEEAFKNFNLALSIDPNFIPAYIEKGLTYYEIDKYDEAIKTFNKVLELEPKNPVAIEFIEKIKNQQKEYSKESSDSAQSLAKHLTNIGAIMYGAYWCPYCSQQKNLFGTDFIHINYVECDPKGTNPKPALCKAKNITGYPTWEINGKMHKGVHSIEELASLSGYKNNK